MLCCFSFPVQFHVMFVGLFYQLLWCWYEKLPADRTVYQQLTLPNAGHQLFSTQGITLPSNLLKPEEFDFELQTEDSCWYWLIYQTRKCCVTSLTENYVSRFELEKLCRWLNSIKFWISMQERKSALNDTIWWRHAASKWFFGSFARVRSIE